MNNNKKKRLFGGTMAGVAVLAGAAFAFSPSRGGGMFVSNGGGNGMHGFRGFGNGFKAGRRLHAWADKFINEDLTDTQKEALETLRVEQKQETKDLVKAYAEKLIPYIDEDKLDDYENMISKVDEIGEGGLVGISRIFIKNRSFLKSDLSDEDMSAIKVLLESLKTDLETIRKGHMEALKPYIDPDMLDEYEDIIDYPLIYGLKGGIINGIGVNGMFKDDLTDDEKEKLNSLIEEHQTELKALMEETMTKMKEMREEHFEDLKDYVDEDKLDEFKEMIENRPLMKMKGMGRGMGHGKGKGRGMGRGMMDDSGF